VRSSHGKGKEGRSETVFPERVRGVGEEREGKRGKERELGGRGRLLSSFP
jgi:hypothetical protein